MKFRGSRELENSGNLFIAVLTAGTGEAATSWPEVVMPPD